jgi:hypothetical protein
VVTILAEGYPSSVIVAGDHVLVFLSGKTIGREESFAIFERRKAASQIRQVMDCASPLALSLCPGHNARDRKLRRAGNCSGSGIASPRVSLQSGRPKTAAAAELDVASARIQPGENPR